MTTPSWGEELMKLTRSQACLPDRGRTPRSHWCELEFPMASSPGTAMVMGMSSLEWKVCQGAAPSDALWALRSFVASSLSEITLSMVAPGAMKNRVAGGLMANRREEALPK